MPAVLGVGLRDRLLFRSRAKSALGLTGLNGLFVLDLFLFDLGLFQHMVDNCIFQD
jgi:hypothetical protein